MSTGTDRLKKFQIATTTTVDLDVLMSHCREAAKEFVATAALPDHISPSSSSSSSLGLHHTRFHGAFLLLFDKIWAEALRISPTLGDNFNAVVTEPPSATLSTSLTALLSIAKEASALSLSLGCAPDARTCERLIRIAGLQSSASARRAFNEIGFRGSVPTRDCLFALLEACAIHNVPCDALPVLFSMKRLGLRPDSTVLSTLLTQADSILERADKDASKGLSLTASIADKLQSLRILQAVAISFAEEELHEAVSEMELSQLQQSALQHSDEQSEETTTFQGDERNVQSNDVEIEEEEAIPVELEKDAEKWRQAVQEVLTTNGKDELSAEGIRDLVLKSRVTEGKSNKESSGIEVDDHNSHRANVDEPSSSSSSSSSPLMLTTANSSPSLIEHSWEDVIVWRVQAQAHAQEMQKRSAQRLESLVLITEEALGRSYKENEKGVDPRLLLAAAKCESDLLFREELLAAVKGRLRSALEHVIPSRVKIVNMEKEKEDQVEATTLLPIESKEKSTLSPLQRSQLTATLVNYCITEEKARRKVYSETTLLQLR